MARRTENYIKAAWTGGLNDTVDPGVLPDNDLVTADNVLVSTSGSRLKREGIDFFDNIDIPTATSVSRSGTTITITFSSDITSASNAIFIVGEKITVLTSDTQFNATEVAIGSIPGNNQITYTVGVTPTAASATLTSITRTATIIGIHDFWYFDTSNNTKNQLLLAVNSDAQFFKYDTNGNRLLITNKTYSVTFTDAGDTVTLNSHGLIEGDSVSFTVITSTTGISVNTIYYVGGTVAANTFQVSATKGGAALALTTNGSGTMVSPLHTTPITSAHFETMNERALIFLSGNKNTPKIFEPGVSTVLVRGLKGAPPNAAIARQHQGRVISNSKDEPDRLYYSAPFDPEKWSGYGDSGVMDIFLGDGDPQGIVSIDPTFKKALFVKKRGKTYIVNGIIPDYTIDAITTGLGAVSHASVSPVDLDDAVYVSYKGIHSLAATASYGDFEGEFLSDKVQNAFKGFIAGRLQYSASLYVPSLNSVFFAFSTGDSSQTRNDTVYYYNTKFKEWYRWPELEAACFCLRSNSSQEQLLFGGYDGRIRKTQVGTFSDYGTDAIFYKIKTGKIYVDGNPNTMKAFKRLGFLYKPKGQYTFTVKIKIDNHQTQSLAFVQVVSGAQLGVDFTLGTSILAFDSGLAPYMQPIDGLGRGIEVTIEQSGIDEQVELYGIIIEWEPADISQETVTNPSGDT